MASALEQFVNNVRLLSAQGNFAALCEFLSKSNDVLSKNVPHLDNVLDTLDLQQHSLGVLAILCVKFCQSNIQDYDALYDQFQLFVTECNGDQIKFAPETYAKLCHLFAQSLVEKRQPICGINLLCLAIRKIQLFNSQLTSVHADLCQLCLLAKCLKPALEFMDVDITDISKEGGHYDAKHFLLYYYYGGMIYTALKNYDRALYFYEIAITTPSMAVSHIMLEAYKKYIMVSLILHGKVMNFPKYTSQVVARFIKPLSQAYHDLVTAYSTNNPDEFRTAMNKHEETFNRDSNMGLVKQCLASLYKKNIQRLTKTFLTLSLTDMANRVQLAGPKDAEQYVLHMIEDGEIFATINQKDGMVIFHDNPEKYNSSEMLRNLDEEMRRCIHLDDKLRQMDEEIMVNPQFVQKCSSIQEDDLPGSGGVLASSKIPSYSM
jgi:COP9 signalosome complex subunit 3